MAANLPLLLLLGFGSVPAHGHTNECYPDLQLYDGEVQTIEPLGTEYKDFLEMTTDLEVFPYESFQGVSVVVVVENGAYHEVWFPKDTCLHWDKKWKRLGVKVQISKNVTNPGLHFFLSVDNCLHWCKEIGNFASIQRLTVRTDGSSDWRLTPSNSCTTKAKHQHKPSWPSSCMKPPYYKIDTSTRPPPITFSHGPTPTSRTKTASTTTPTSTTTPSPHPHSPCTSNKGSNTDTSDTVLMVVVVVGLVAVAVAVVVMVVVAVVVVRSRLAARLPRD